MVRSACALMCLLAASPASAAFIEGDFSMRCGEYRYVDGAGWEGRRAVVFESAEPCGGPCPMKSVDLKPGFQYEFTGLVRANLAEGGIVQLSLSWFDASGRRLGSTIGIPVNDNEVLPDGWVRYGAKTPIIPAEATRALYHFYVARGGKGRAVFDRFTLKRLDAKWVGPLLSSAYQNIAVDGKVRFVVPLSHFDALKIPADSLTAAFTVQGVDGREKTLPPTFFDGTRAELAVDVADLAKGRHAVAFEVHTAERSYGAARCEFTRLDSLPERKVWIDRRKRLIVNGKPFFMLGMYWRKITAEELDAFCPSPFNTVLPCQDPERWQFDLCARRGLMMCYPFEHRYDVPGEATNVVRIVNELKDHPALLLWYLNDERPASLVGQVQARHDTVLSLDDQHPTWSVTDKPTLVRDFLGTFEIIGTDAYPIGNSTPRYDRPLEMVLKYARIAREGSMDLYPLWHVPQAFSWGWFRKNVHDYLDVRYPTREELRQMTWQYLAAGANGIMYYSFNTLRDFAKGADFEAKWTELKEIAAEVKSFEKVFLSDEDAPVVSGMTESVGARAWRHDGNVWLLVVNATRRPQKVRLALDCAVSGPVRSIFGTKPSPIGTSSFACDLKPLECVFVSFPD
ncbi:MAG: hypothetical protein IKO72_05460 [Kiritimatiellae bacterium]|nr:hypothetical protein [Kiritimatiellia bacterium]